MKLSRKQVVLLLLPFAVVVIPFLILPAILSFPFSLTNFTLLQKTVRFVGFDNYSRLLEDDVFRVSLKNIILMTVLTVSAEMILGVGLACALRKPFRGRMMVRLLLLIPWLVSPAASGVMWARMFNERSGLISYWPALVGMLNQPHLLGIKTAFWSVIVTEIWRKTPLVTFLILPGVTAIPAELWEQSRLDGLGVVKVIRHVVIPGARRLLLVVGLLVMGDSLGTSESVYFLTGGGPGTLTMTPGIYSYNLAAMGQNWARAATAGWFIVLAVVIAGLWYLYGARRES
jgi:multiple sugar transport system permease protein